MNKARPLLNPRGSSDFNKRIKQQNKQKRKFFSKLFADRKKSKSTNRKSPTKLAAEQRYLENIVFNSTASFLNSLDKNVDLVAVDLNKDISDNVDELPNDIFIVDRTGDVQFDIDEVSEKESRDNDNVKVPKDYDDYDDDDDDDDDEYARNIRTELFDQQQKRDSSSKPKWQDEDDEIEAGEGLQGCDKMPKLVKSTDKYKQYLERKFTSIYEPPNWAKKALEESKDTKNKRKQKQYSDDSEDDDDDLMIEQTAFNQIKSLRNGGQQLDKDFLRVKKCSHLNVSSRVKTSLNCVNFHPNSTVALVGSQIGLVRLFQVDGKLNSIIQSIYFQGFRLSDVKFLSANGREEIIVGSDGSNPKSKGFCYFYDMIAGKIVRVRLSKGGKNNYSLRGFQLSPNGQYLAACDENGNINLLTASTKELIQEMKINGEVNCLSFSPDSNYLLAHGYQNGCQAFIFDIRNSKSTCVNRFNDPDTIVATSMDVSRTESMVAIGSNMGVVNLYRFEDVLKQSNPPIVKSVMNLTTSIRSLRFNHDGQLLLMASDQSNDAIRFLNTNSLTVYKNFPLLVGGNGKTYGRIHDLDFSPNSGYFSFVTGYGTAHLFRINEYSSY